MTTIYLYTFTSLIAISLFSFIGVFALALREEVLRKYIFIFISIAVGALLGDAIIHLIPEALENSVNATTTSVLIIAGIVFFFVLEKFLHWHHHGEDQAEDSVHPVGKLVFISDGIHNFMDGIIIAASFMVSIPLGIATTMAVILHEIPQEIGDFGVLLHSGYSKAKALWLNFLSGLSAILGAVLLFAIGGQVETVSTWLLPVAAGGFIYIAVADLIPELHKTKEAKHSIFQIIAVMIGVLAMIALTFME